jgi:hypothetical protein
MVEIIQLIMEIENQKNIKEKDKNKEQEAAVFDSQKGTGERNWT